jgi:pimeloyl-ACP methyl ester carboxylesterase
VDGVAGTFAVLAACHIAAQHIRRWQLLPGAIVNSFQVSRHVGREHSYRTAGLVLAAVLAGTAVVTQMRSRKAERENPPSGRFIEVGGLRLHYVERGSGQPLVLLHGNGSMIQDFETSGLLDLAAERYRVIAFDRPGYGHSERPRSTIWTPAAQADLLHAALQMLGVSRSIVLGHSWGASVAVALGLRHPEAVQALVLASGYYYPTVRADVALMSGPAVPIVGDVLRYTIAPLVANLMVPGVLRKIFGPAPVPARFAQFPIGLALRPGQLRASAAESALMIPDAIALRAHYRELKMPVVLVAGADDKLVTTERQSARLHAEIPHSTFHSMPGTGHMVHHSAPHSVLAAIDEAARAAATPALSSNRPLAA